MEIDNVRETNSRKVERTVLSWDPYMQYLIEAIDESNFMKRAETKPMATPKGSLESHVTSRATHVRNAANIMRRLAKGLGLNSKFAYAGMLMHDAGHPFSGHEGEVIFSDIGGLNNTQYFHHNAKGVEIILSEDICEKAISKIPNIELNPKLRDKLREEFYYFLDIVISHDGEASPAEMYREADEYPDIRTAVEEKLCSANSRNKYKFVAQTPEGKLGKYADVIAYLSTDIQDGFRLGIYKDFPDDYLEVFGEMFSTSFARTREEKIANARTIIDQIKEKRLRELFDDARLPGNQRAIRIANEIMADLREKGLDFENDEDAAMEVVEEHLEKMQSLYGKNMTDEKLQYMYSEMEKVREFVGKKSRLRSGVVAEVTTRMQEYFINDLLKESVETGIPHFSSTAERLFFKAKKINYATYTPYVKWQYQKEALPNAALRLAAMSAASLITTGAVRNKFFDPTVREFVDHDIAASMKVGPRLHENVRQAQERYLAMRKKYGIRNFRSSNKKFTGDQAVSKIQSRYELFASIYEHLQNQGESFARQYTLTYHAIEQRIRDKVSKALNPDYPEKDAEKSLYADRYIGKINHIRDAIKFKYGSLELTPEQQEEVVQNLIEHERQFMERHMAMQVATDYISGMSDNAFTELALRTGVLSKEELEKTTTRIPPHEAAENHIVAQLAKDMEHRPPDNHFSQENPEGNGDGR